MKVGPLALLAILSTGVVSGYTSGAPAGTTEDAFTFPQTRGATYDEIRKYQALGKFVVAPDASFFLYEWSRPYNWMPLRGSLSRATQRRPQTLLYRVPVPAAADWSDVDPPTSEALLPALPGATYYLGTLSPDAKRVTFYELDRDDNALRAGIVLLSEQLPRDITWLSLPPDEARLEEPAVWLSNDEVVYPIKAGVARLARASVQTGHAEPCRHCSALVPPPKSFTVPSPAPDIGTDVRPGRPVLPPASAPTLPATAKAIAGSPDGALLIYAVDTPQTLELYFRTKGRVVELFRNQRLPSNMVGRK